MYPGLFRDIASSEANSVLLAVDYFISDDDNFVLTAQGFTNSTNLHPFNHFLMANLKYFAGPK